MNTTQLLEKAVSLHQAGKLDKAEPLYLQILAAEPGHAKARQLLGTLRMDQERFEEALTELDAALALDPHSIEALMQKGMALTALDRAQEALAHYDAILALGPGFPPALYFRGNLLMTLGRLEAALASFDQALASEQRFAEAWLGRGAVLHRLHRFQEAVASFERALVHQPDYADAWFSRAASLAEMGNPQEALASSDRAIALRPDFVQAHHNRSLTLMALRRYNDAAASYEKTLALDSSVKFAFGGLSAAVLYACDWDKVAALEDEVREHVVQAKSFMSPGALIGYSDDAALLRQAAALYTKNIVGEVPPPLWHGAVFRNPKIRIAYMSGDYHDHATAYLIAELFERHDRTRFDIWGIGLDADDGSAIRRRVIRAFDRFEDVREISDQTAAQFLYDNKVDIVVDLMGHTLNARPAICARRPAPIQVSYLGFPGTMGADFYDYILGDKIVLPMDQQPYFAEAIVQLPDCYQCNDSTRTVRPAPTRVQAGLPAEGFVFCCFNNNWKITRPFFDVWMRLLAAVPDSVLWLIADNPDAVANLRQAAAARGVDSSRLIFAPRLDVDLHLARHRLADLFLDTLPYNAHTTANDALRAGVPLVTLTGRAFAGRVATSLLHTLGLPELAVANLEDYERLALALAQEPARLAALKAKLAEKRRTSPLFDADRFRRGIESAYDEMWQIWQRGEAPHNFAVPPVA